MRLFILIQIIMLAACGSTPEALAPSSLNLSPIHSAAPSRVELIAKQAEGLSALIAAITVAEQSASACGPVSPSSEQSAFLSDARRILGDPATFTADLKTSLTAETSFLAGASDADSLALAPETYYAYIIVWKPKRRGPGSIFGHSAFLISNKELSPGGENLRASNVASYVSWDRGNDFRADSEILSPHLITPLGTLGAARLAQFNHWLGESVLKSVQTKIDSSSLHATINKLMRRLATRFGNEITADMLATIARGQVPSQWSRVDKHSAVRDARSALFLQKNAVEFSALDLILKDSLKTAPLAGYTFAKEALVPIFETLSAGERSALTAKIQQFHVLSNAFKQIQFASYHMLSFSCVNATNACVRTVFPEKTISRASIFPMTNAALIKTRMEAPADTLAKPKPSTAIIAYQPPVKHRGLQLAENAAACFQPIQEQLLIEQTSLLNELRITSAALALWTL